MVKGVSKQVIVVQSPDREHFEQAIFILKDGQAQVTDEILLREAKRLFVTRNATRTKNSVYRNAICAASGAMLTGLAWLLSVLL